MAKIYMKDFRVTTSVVPVLRYLDGNKTDELVIFTDDKMTDFDTHIALIDNNVVKLFANESGFAAIIDKDIFNEKDVCPIRLVFSNSETEKTKGTNTFYICNDRTGYVYGDYIEVPDDIITYREACRAYAEECGRIVDAVKFDVGAKVTQDEDGATIYITDPFGTTKAKVYNGERGPAGDRGPEPEITARVVRDNTEILSNGVVIATLAGGKNGIDGHTPKITATKEGATVTIYADGVKVIDIHDGVDGATGPRGIPGKDGHSPSVTATKSGTVTTVKVDGTAIATINDGVDGATGVAGKDGHSPTVTATKAGNATTLSIDGKATATIYDGETGPQGIPGKAGHSPIITATRKGTETKFSLDGNVIATISDGATGATGHSPSVTATKAGTATTISVDGVAIATVNDGERGETGATGHSPSVTATKAGTVTTVKVDGVAIATINDGAKGDTGKQGPAYVLTDADKALITNEVLAQFTNAESTGM